MGGRDLSDSKKTEIRVLLQEGYSSRAISRRTGVSQSSVLRVKNAPIQSKRKNCGRKRITSRHDDRALLRCLRRNPLSTANEMKSYLEETGTKVSVRTVQMRLHQLGARSVVPRKVPPLTKKMKKARLEFAKKHEAWTVGDWKMVREILNILMFMIDSLI